MAAVAVAVVSTIAALASPFARITTHCLEADPT